MILTGLIFYRFFTGARTSDAVAPAAPSTTLGGVRRVRFLRRAPRLPWEEEIQDASVEEKVVVKSRRKRIQLPLIEKIKEEIDPIPVAAFKEIDGISITVPEIGTAVLEKIADEEEDLLLWMI